MRKASQSGETEPDAKRQRSRDSADETVKPTDMHMEKDERGSSAESGRDDALNISRPEPRSISFPTTTSSQETLISGPGTSGRVLSDLFLSQARSGAISNDLRSGLASQHGTGTNHHFLGYPMQGHFPPVPNHHAFLAMSHNNLLSQQSMHFPVAPASSSSSGNPLQQFINFGGDPNLALQQLSSSGFAGPPPQPSNLSAAALADAMLLARALNAPPNPAAALPPGAPGAGLDPLTVALLCGAANRGMFPDYLQGAAASRQPTNTAPAFHPPLPAAPAAAAASQATSSGPSIPGPALGHTVPLALSTDRGVLSEYQSLLREQILLFEATKDDIKASAQGRNRPIRKGQVGIICRHCAHLNPKYRPRGATYFPAKLCGIYQSAQNMSGNHFSDACRTIPESVRAQMMTHRSNKTLVHGGGKAYWMDSATALGVVETEHGLEFQRSTS